ncbi:hypothetical protein [uncultured Leifsonia sp.]|uniref:hypothetical protein n=1 Tax=uncultured Leifsonia sp. TaxID=340359 RepID=UPI0028D4F993|nr:hypothetical protein [uncultured Leifsonia sp.]
MRLIPVDDAVGFHVAKRTYAQPSAPFRSPDVHRQEWGRFDTLGRTYYLAETAECAFAEVLAPLRRKNGSEDPLSPIAASLDLTIEETVAAIAEEWAETDFRGVGALPSTWHERRRLYRARIVDGGWLVDIEHPDTIAALQGSADSVAARFLANQGIPSLTTAVLRSDNRLVTTMLSELVRDAELDDGESPRGIHFGSKHGGSWCRAVWLPYHEVARPGVEITAAEDIASSDPAMRAVARRLGLFG